jgi:hypothetical protein
MLACRLQRDRRGERRLSGLALPLSWSVQYTATPFVRVDHCCCFSRFLGEGLLLWNLKLYLITCLKLWSCFKPYVAEIQGSITQSSGMVWLLPLVISITSSKVQMLYTAVRVNTIARSWTASPKKSVQQELLSFHHNANVLFCTSPPAQLDQMTVRDDALAFDFCVL